MAKVPAGTPLTHPTEWARQCRIEAARAIHPKTRAFLLKLAGEYEVIAGKRVDLDPDDPDYQAAVADRLAELALRREEWSRR
jgi:hypothetical protein